ncbi:hypothetical protein Pla108_08490 [Botrimarina colliarenosi]|uniref:Uncharacterized protein n=1 Tax=Botrimarina colliarenosi TaxID=2528001 RepID=A0A5C6AKD9_9BACT|nr:hypothetical protein [Botrimarina colliarenosi]TWT99906.1 hypothetical protein Pla108_08490 [Botrimarina colliarenosi]
MHDKADRFGRGLLFALLVLVSPVAVFLCGFCSCLGVVGGGLPGEVAWAAFWVGLLVGLFVAVLLLIRAYKWLFVVEPILMEDVRTDD